MKVTIKEMCDRRGVKSAYELAKRTGYDHKKEKQDKGALNMPTAYRAFANNMRRFELDTLEALCRALDCTPNDIFGFESKPQMPAKAAEIAFNGTDSEIRKSVGSAQSDAVKADDSILIDLPELDDENDTWLTTNQAADAINRKPRTIRDFYKQGLPSVQTTKGHFVKYSDLSAFWKARSAQG